MGKDSSVALEQETRSGKPKRVDIVKEVKYRENLSFALLPLSLV